MKSHDAILTSIEFHILWFAFVQSYNLKTSTTGKRTCNLGCQNQGTACLYDHFDRVLVKGPIGI